MGPRWGRWHVTSLPSEGTGRRHLTPGGDKRAACLWVCVGGCEEGRGEEAGFLKLLTDRLTDTQMADGSSLRGTAAVGSLWAA